MERIPQNDSRALSASAVGLTAANQVSLPVLYDYQEALVEQLRQAIRSRLFPVLLYAPCGAGKGTLAAFMIGRAVAQGYRVLFLVNRRGLVHDLSRRLDRMGVPHGIIMANSGRSQPWQGVQVCSIDTLYRRDTVPKADLVFIDECFPSTTTVDGRSIAEIQPGDFVRSFNHATGMIGRSRVLAISRRRCTALCRVRLSGEKSITCTPNHPLYTDRGYVAASDLVPGDQVYENTQLCSLREAIPKSRTIKQTDSNLLQGMPGSETRRAQVEDRSSLQNLRDHCSRAGARKVEAGEQHSALLGVLPQGIATARTGEDHPEANRPQPEVRIRAHDRPQPDEQSGNERKGQPHLTSDGVAAHSSARKRLVHGSASFSCVEVGTWMGTGVSGEDEGSGSWSLPESGHRQPDAEDCNRSGRQQSPLREGAGKGQAENRDLAALGVDVVEVLEPGSDGRFGGLCPDGHVYNLEVDGSHNYFADGLLVHNCHFSLSAKWSAIINRFSGTPVIGMSASPVRADGRGLGEFYKHMVLGPSPAELIERKFLVPTRVFAPPPPDLSGVKIQHGEYNQRQLAEVVDKKPLVGDIVDHWARIGRNRPTVLFGVNRIHAQHCCDRLVGAGIRAVYADANTPDVERERLWRRLAVYDVEVACTVDIVSYGWDVPEVACAIDARPTASLANWLQRIGRVQRTARGKVDSLYLDHAGNTGRFGFAEDPREWSLEGCQRRARNVERDTGLAVRTCKFCFAVFRSVLDLCPHCGATYASQTKTPDVVDGELEEITPDKRPAYTIRHLSRNPKVAELQKTAAERGYKPGWLWHQMKRLREKGELSA